MQLSFAEWRPDQDKLNSDFATYLNNVLCAAGHYIPMPQCSAVSSALAAAPLSAFTAIDDGGSVHVFAGTATKLYKLDTADYTWDDVSKAATTYSAGTSARWAWKQFGLVVLAANRNNAVQAFTLGSSSTFDNLAGSPPQAGGIAVSGDYVILYRLNGAPRKIQWCDTDDITDWSTGNSGSQTFPDGGDVMGVSDATHPIVVQEKAIRMGQYVPGGGIFQFTKVYSNRGCVAPYSFCQRSENIFFADSGGFFQIDPAGQLTPIGYEKVDRHIFESASANDIIDILGSVDPFYARVYFLVRGGATGSEYNLLLTYDWQLQRWTRASVSLYCMMPAASLGYTLSGLDAFGTIADLPAPFGSKVWQGGAPIMGGFDTDNKLCYFNGDSAAATLRTAEYGDPTGTVQFIRSVLPITDTSSAYVRLGARMLRGADVEWTVEQPVSTAHGRVLIQSRARFHRAEMRIPAGVDWTTAQGLDVEAQAAGMR